MKSQVGNMFFSVILGWWGFPWGLMMTPLQIARNMIGLFKIPDQNNPSDKLKNIVKVNIATQLIQQQSEA